MKKFLILILMISFSMGISAQMPFTFGPKIGLNISKLPAQINNVTNLNSSNIYGVNAGLFLRINIKKFYIQPEVYFSMKGGKINYIDSLIQRNKNIKLNTIDIPLLFGFKAFDAKLINLRILAGPVLSIPLNKSVSETFNPSHSINESDFKNSLWAIQAGLGLDLFMFTVDFRYEWGLTKIYNQNNVSFKNNMFYLSLGWKIL